MALPADNPTDARAGAGGVPADEAEGLLERVAAGDSAALLALYDRHSGSMLALALRITRSKAEAEEVVQDAFTRAWKEAPAFDRRRGSALAWLLTLTRNRAIDILRSRRRRTRHEEDAEATPGDAPGTPERAVVDAQRAAAVRLALETLTDAQRKVLELAYYGGLSHSEIAAELGQPLGTVKTRILQAAKKLREALARFRSDGDAQG